MSRELSDEQRREAAEGDLNVLAVLTFVSSTAFALVSGWIGLIGWIAVVATVSSALATTLGLLRRNDVIVAFVQVGFGISGLAAPIVAIAGLVLGLVGITWGWAVLGGAVIYFGLSVLGLEIIERAETAGVITKY
ncbi:MAG: hypothetical protein EX269_14615 [Acidimicrobiales bacterium]|nr:MAG: hypothetical protein EX269_14615 [Acidimicrobiales bacterium]